MLIWMTSALYVYEFFEMFHAVCLFPTVPQFETLEYVFVQIKSFCFEKCKFIRKELVFVYVALLTK